MSIFCSPPPLQSLRSGTALRGLWLALALSGVGCVDQSRPPEETRDPFPPRADAISPTDDQDKGPTGIDRAPLEIDQGPSLDATPILDQSPADLEPALDQREPDGEVIDRELPEGDQLFVPVRPARVEARWGLVETRAGQENQVSCLLFDDEGEPVDDFAPTLELRPAEGWEELVEEEEVPEGSPRRFIASRAGHYEATCVLAREGLRSAPAPWIVEPGLELVSRAELAPREAEVDRPISVTCAYEDLWGNAVELPIEEQALTISPAAPGTRSEGAELFFERAGLYQVSCEGAGVVDALPESVEIVAGPAATLTVSISPNLPFVSPGTVVQLETRVTDRFSNPISGAPIRFESAPELPNFGVGRFLAEREGEYLLTASLSEGTFEDRPLSGQIQLVVDGGAPTIRCLSPDAAEMLTLGDPVVLRGEVADNVEIDQVTVDGRPAQLDARGRFSVAVDPEWGLNVYSVNARDRFGQVSSTFCTVFAADRYGAEADALSDLITLTLGQRAIDDGPGANPVRSFTDIFRAMLNSQGIIDVIDSSLRAANPILPSTCYERLPIVGTCIFRASATYRGLSLGGPNTVSSSLITRGIRVDARLEDLDLDIDIAMTGPDLSGTVSAESIEATLLFDLSLRGGQPSVRLRNSDQNQVVVGRLSSDFGGLAGWLADLIFPAVEGIIRGQVTQEIEGFLEGQLDSILSGVLSNLDLSAISADLQLPSPGGGAPVELSLAFDFSSLSSRPERLLLAIDSQSGGRATHARPSAGIPRVSGTPRREVALIGQQSAGAALSVDFLNQALHQLWRGGLFDIEPDAPILGGTPEGFALSFTLTLPPTLSLEEGRRARVSLGPAIGTLSYPALFPEPITIRIAAFATSTVSLDGDLLSFSAPDGVIELEELYLDLEGIALSPQERGLLEGDFRRIIGSLLGAALNDALPALPLPDFALPDSLSSYGIARGTRLGVRSPVLSSDRTHLTLKGVFGQ